MMNKFGMRRMGLATLCACLLAGGLPAGDTMSPEELHSSYDVVIAGAGTAGVMAAIQAARLGADVLLLEETDWIGGQMSAAAVSSMDEGSEYLGVGVYRGSVRERGAYRDFVTYAQEHYDALGLSADTCYITENHFGVEPRAGQEILHAMMADTRAAHPEARLDVTLLSRVTGVVREGNRITGVHVDFGLEGQTQSRTIGSTILIDSTEWGDVLPLAGVPYRIGNWISTDDHTGATSFPPVQDFTWTAVIRDYGEAPPASLDFPGPPPGYDVNRLKVALDTVEPYNSTSPWSWERFIAYRGMPDSANPNTDVANPWADVTRTHINFHSNDWHVNVNDVEDPQARLQLERDLKVRTLQVLYYLRHDMSTPKTTWHVANDEGYDTAFNRWQNARLVAAFPELAPFEEIMNHFPVMPYVRESRRMIGVHTIRASEIDRRNGGPMEFPTAVATGDYALDLHGNNAPETIEADLDTPEDIEAIGFQTNKVGPFQIPFEAFIPLETDGFLAAEKNISQSRLVNGATRLQPSTMLIGQAAGAIAGVAVRDGVQPRHVRPAVVQEALLKSGNVLYVKRFDDHKFEGVEMYSDLWNATQMCLLHGVLKVADKDPIASQWNVVSGGLGNPGWFTNEDGEIVFNSSSGILTASGALGDGTPADSLSDYVIETQFNRATGVGVAGVVGRYQNSSNFLHGRVSGSSLQLYQWKDGTATMLASVPAGYVNGQTWKMAMTFDGPSLTLVVHDASGTERGRLTHTLADSSDGEVGLRAQAGGAEIRFSEVVIRDLQGDPLFEAQGTPPMSVATGMLTTKWADIFLQRQFGASPLSIEGHRAAQVLTKAELATAIAEAMGYENFTIPSTPYFGDVQPGHPAFGAVQFLANQGVGDVIFRRSGDQFLPDEAMSIADHLMIAAEIEVEGVPQVTLLADSCGLAVY